MSKTPEFNWYQVVMDEWQRNDGVRVSKARVPGEEWFYIRERVGTFESAAGAMDYADRFIPDQREAKAPTEWTPPPATMAGPDEYAMRTGLSDDNPKTAYGDRKPPLHLVPPALTIAAAGVFKLGARKYGAYNWREKKVSSSVYVGAALRHIHAFWDGEDTDPESGESHLAHAAACLGILLDAGAIDRLNDDRPVAGAAARIIREKEEKGETS